MIGKPNNDVQLRELLRGNKGVAPRMLIEEMNLVTDSMVKPKTLKEVLASDHKQQ